MNMRAKMLLGTVTQQGNGDKITSETLSFTAVAKSGSYPEDGSDEDNTFARFTPSAACTIQVTNPDLIGKFTPGSKYYVDFTPAD